MFYKIVETGESDHHHMVYTMIKLTYIKLPPTRLKFRCYKSFDEMKFLHDLDFALNNVPIGNYTLFEVVQERYFKQTRSTELKVSTYKRQAVYGKRAT